MPFVVKTLDEIKSRMPSAGKSLSNIFGCKPAESPEDISVEINYPRVAGIKPSRIHKTARKPYLRAEGIARTAISPPISQWHNSKQVEFVPVTPVGHIA